MEAYRAENLIAARWSGDDLSAGQVCAGVITHPHTGDEVCFNHTAFRTPRPSTSCTRA